MPVNSLFNRAASVLLVLGYSDPNADLELLARVEKFIACNGYEGILRAAEGLRPRLESGKVTDPWAYTVEAYNRSLAELSHLYSLVNLVESGLRSRVDIGYSQAIGEHWYRSPHLYLPTPRVSSFVADASQPRIRWQPVGPGSQPTQIADLGSVALFLEELTFGWLNQIVLHGYTPHGALRNVLLTSDQQRISTSEATSLLTLAKDTRNNVAHNKFVSPNAYESSRKRLVRLLELLQFDVPRTIQRMERERARLMRDVFQQVGLSDPAIELLRRLKRKILTNPFLPTLESGQLDEAAAAQLREALTELRQAWATARTLDADLVIHIVGFTARIRHAMAYFDLDEGPGATTAAREIAKQIDDLATACLPGRASVR